MLAWRHIGVGILQVATKAAVIHFLAGLHEMVARLSRLGSFFLSQEIFATAVGILVMPLR